MIKRILVSLVVVLVLFSCKENKKKAVVVDNSPKYEIVKGSETLKWTAYKTTSKVGVNGIFDGVSFDFGKDERTLNNIIDNIKISIVLDSVNSDNPDRDNKLRNSFFGLFKGKLIEGITNQKNKVIAMNMNGLYKNQKFDFKIEDQKDGSKKVISNIQIDLKYWEVLSALESLNEICKDLHKGEDGISKTWEQVDVEVTYIIKKIK